jgi:Ca2+-binding RTX toxin-like protein
MQFPSRKARVALLAGAATLGAAGTASASTADYSTTTNVLTITADAGAGPDVLECVGGVVKFNGNDPTRTPAAGGPTTGCAASVGLVVNGDAAANDLDLRGVTRADWAGLVAANAAPAIKLGDGDDQLRGTEFPDVINPGNGDDSVNGHDGADTMIWLPGEANDVMTGGDGVDTVVDEGGNGPEQFEIKPKATDPTRVDASRINNPFTLDIDAEKLLIKGNGGDDSITGLPGTADLIKVTYEGGDGNDALIGTDGNDVMNGGPGNDSLLGAKGNDTMNGGDNDDVMTWNPGEGTDVMNGDAGNDTAVDNGGNGVEHFIVTAQGQRVTATRDNLAPFFLDIGTTETLDLNANGGDDTVEVNKGLGALIKVDVNLGEGNDAIAARNGAVDVIDGAGGTDAATTDANDQVTNVERGGAAKKVAFVSKKLKVKGGKAKLRITCPAGGVGCKGKAAILRGKKVVGSIAIDMRPGQTKNYRIQLNQKTRVRLAKDADGKLKATARVRYAAGGATITSKKALKLVG